MDSTYLTGVWKVLPESSTASVVGHVGVVPLLTETDEAWCDNADIDLSY